MNSRQVRNAIRTALKSRTDLSAVKLAAKHGCKTKAVHEVVDVVLSSLRSVLAEALAEGDIVIFGDLLAVRPRFKRGGKLSFRVSIDRSFANGVRKEIASRGLWGEDVCLSRIQDLNAREITLGPS